MQKNPFIIKIAWRGNTLKVFNFEDSSFTSDLSYASLFNSPRLELPNKFIICSTLLQGKIYDNNSYILYDDDKLPWFSISIWEVSGKITLWADVQYGLWYQLGVINKPWTNYWIHICVEIDTAFGKFSASVKGNEAFELEVEEIFSYKPRELHLIIGLVDSRRIVI